MGTERADWAQAERLNELGRERGAAGDQDGALTCYQQAVDLVPEYEPAWFNMGLVYKRRREWRRAYECNAHAAALGGGEGDPALWNLGIAATGLRAWDAARNAWRRFGIEVPEGTGELRMQWGATPVRLHTNGEVTWGQRIDPARAIVKNVPLPESGHRWGDVVLHDGAPHGERRAFGKVYPVFDELERWQPSDIPTLEVSVTVVADTDAQALTELFDKAGFAAQDWTSTTRQLCKQCSEGLPPESHDHFPAPAAADRRFGLAAPPDKATCLLADWAAALPGSRTHGEPAVVG